MRPTARFCLDCGAALRETEQDGRTRKVCPASGWVYYPQLKVSAGCLIEQDGALLLVRRALPPWQGCWYLPAGYVEADEDPARAAERETWEETGLVVQVGQEFGVYYFDDDPRGNGVVVIYRARILDGSLRGSPEGFEMGFFSPAELPSPLAGAGHDRAVRDWLNRSPQTDPGCPWN